jgi:peptidoglycan/LPS O-acetylase OafA/YrhL
MSPSVLDEQLGLAAIYAACLYACSWLCAWSLQRLPAVEVARSDTGGRHGCVDGLRGVLAIGVMVHHSVASYGYFNGQPWRYGESTLLNQLGQSSVAVFFMITGFLFALKTRTASIDWARLYLGRIARIYPLYVLVLLAVFVISIGTAGWVLHDPLSTLLHKFGSWMTFTMPGINGAAHSWPMVAGVSWSLRYEMFFYLLGVPLLHQCARHLSARQRLLLTGVLLAACLSWQGGEGHLKGPRLYTAHFLCGVLVACLTELPLGRAALRHRALHVTAGAALVWLVCTQVDGNNTLAILAAATGFGAVVGGASGLGLLRTRSAIWLGDISYGIYLLHGLTLWTMWTLVSQVRPLASISTVPYVASMAALSVAVCLLASLSYLRVELPAIQRWNRVKAPTRVATQ